MPTIAWKYDRPTASKWIRSKSQRNQLQRMRNVIMCLASSFLWGAMRRANAYPRHGSRVRWHPIISSLRPMLIISSILIVARFPLTCHAVGYSYARFVGPVIGPEREIFVRDRINGGSRIDYVARPDYQFAYGVEDSETQVLQNRKETRNGDEVNGVYSVVDPDGTLRVVKYTADNLNGFQAEVITNGVATLHGHNGDGDGDGGGSFKDNTDDNFANQNNYEVHHHHDHHDNQYDENSDDHSTESSDDESYDDSHEDAKSNGNSENDSDDDDDNDDAYQVEEYGEEAAHSEEVNDADSDEINDY